MVVGFYWDPEALDANKLLNGYLRSAVWMDCSEIIEKLELKYV